MPGVKKSNQKKRHPGERALAGARTGYGVFRQHVLCWRKTGWHPCQPPFGLSFTRSPRSTGPRFKSQSSARCAHVSLSPRASRAVTPPRHMLSLFALRLLLFALRSSSSARIARKGSPYAVSERGTKRPAGESAWMPIPFRQGRKPCRKARLPLTPRRAPPGEHRIWGALSLGYFSLGTQRKVTRPSADGRNARRAGEQPDGNA